MPEQTDVVVGGSRRGLLSLAACWPTGVGVHPGRERFEASITMMKNLIIWPTLPLHQRDGLGGSARPPEGRRGRRGLIQARWNRWGRPERRPRALAFRFTDT